MKLERLGTKLLVGTKNIFRTSRLKKVTFNTLSKIAIYVLLIGMAFVFLFPIFYMLSLSLKQPIDLLDMSAKWIVKDPKWDNYSEVFYDIDYLKVLSITTITSVVCAAAQVLSCSFVAYGIARFKFPGKNLVFGMVIFSLVIPPQVLVIPLFMQYSAFKMIDTFIPIIAPCFLGMGLRGGLFIFIFVQFFKGLPKELEEAARIDGCGVIKTFRSIVLPISKSSVLVTTILSLVWHWNDYFEPKIFLHAANKVTLTFAVQRVLIRDNFIMSSAGQVLNPKGMAGAAMAILPLLIIYLILQKRFIAGVERTGLAN